MPSLQHLSVHALSVPDFALATLLSALKTKGDQLLKHKLWVSNVEGDHWWPENLLSLVPNVQRLGVYDDSMCRQASADLPDLRRLDFRDPGAYFGCRDGDRSLLSKLLLQPVLLFSKLSEISVRYTNFRRLQTTSEDLLALAAAAFLKVRGIALLDR
jgi:hypothetical protein